MGQETQAHTLGRGTLSSQIGDMRMASSGSSSKMVIS